MGRLPVKRALPLLLPAPIVKFGFVIIPANCFCLFFCSSSRRHRVLIFGSIVLDILACLGVLPSL